MAVDYVILGGSGYIGQAFVEELERRGRECISLSRQLVDYTDFRLLLKFLRDTKPKFLINCAGYTGKPNVDACERARNATILGNITLVETIANACDVSGIPFGHVSSGCIYSGGKLPIHGSAQVVRNLMAPDVQPLWANCRNVISGFTEEDLPNFSFDSPPCSFYSGTKAAAEALLRTRDNHFVWRLRIPFDDRRNPRNYLTKLMTYDRLYDNANSFSHRGEFATGCIELWERRAPFGTYNVTNPGWLTTRDVVSLIKENWGRQKEFQFFAGDEEFYATAAETPRSNAILDTSKMRAVEIELIPVREAIAAAIRLRASS